MISVLDNQSIIKLKLSVKVGYIYILIKYFQNIIFYWNGYKHKNFFNCIKIL